MKGEPCDVLGGESTSPNVMGMSQFLSIALPGGTCGAFMARPMCQAATPAVLVLPEAFGVNPGMREICEDLSRLGYCALCPDILWRVDPGVSLADDLAEDREHAMRRAIAFDLAHGIDDVTAIVAMLRGSYGLDGRVAVVGYGLGGLLAFVSTAGCHLDAAVAYYPMDVERYLDGAATMNTPLLVHLGAEDESIPSAVQAAIIGALDELPQAEVEVHARAGHAFARRHSALFERGAAAEAARYTADFLQAFLA
jgi:carboxymethylenebutenolidase